MSSGVVVSVVVAQNQSALSRPAATSSATCRFRRLSTLEHQRCNLYSTGLHTNCWHRKFPCHEKFTVRTCLARTFAFVWYAFCGLAKDRCNKSAFIILRGLSYSSHFTALRWTVLSRLACTVKHVIFRWHQIFAVWAETRN